LRGEGKGGGGVVVFIFPSPYSPPVKGREIVVLEIPMIITERFIIRKCKYF
jgi:hypothetical protein